LLLRLVAVVKFAIADPPYIGQARRHYGDHPDYGGEVDHAALIARLVADYPDGWAMCLSSPTLKAVLNLCPEDVRVGAWVKPWAVWKPGMSVAYAWEPVVWRGGRKRTKQQETARDWVTANAVMRRAGDPNQTKGSKPDAFCFWLFELLNAQDGDTLDDLFPGSGAVTAAWAKWRRQLWSA
jgi:hypothetical protein